MPLPPKSRGATLRRPTALIANKKDPSMTTPSTPSAPARPAELPTVELHDRTLAVRGRAAIPEERPRLWELWRRYDGANLDSWASRRPQETAVVILEPVQP